MAYRPTEVNWMVSNWDRMSWGEQKELQNYKLRKHIRDVLYPYSAYYRKLFDDNGIKPDSIKTVEDLVHIPFTSKPDIAPTLDNMNRPFDFILKHPDIENWRQLPTKERRAAWLSQPDWQLSINERLIFEWLPIHVHFTTGRTALPTPIWHSYRDLLTMQTIMSKRVPQMMRTDPFQMIINTIPFAPHLGFYGNTFAVMEGQTPFLNTGGGRNMPTAQVLTLANWLGITSFQGISSYTYHMVREALNKGMKLPDLRTVTLMGDLKITRELKEKIVDMMVELGAERDLITFPEYYSFTEAKTDGGSSCNEPGDFESYGYHTYPDLSIWEVVDPKTGMHLPDGEKGNLVYTPLEWRGSVIFRWNTGDIASIVHEPCPNCGRTVPRISTDISRSTDVKEFQLSKVKGTLIDLMALPGVIQAYPGIQEWYLEIRKERDDPYGLDRLVLYLTSKESVDRSELMRGLNERLKSEFEVTINEFKFVPIEEVLQLMGMETEIKATKVKDLRPVL